MSDFARLFLDETRRLVESLDAGRIERLATGLAGVQVFQGHSSGDGGTAPYIAMAHLSFESPDALQASLTGPRAAEVFSDIARFTDIQPLTQVSDPR